MDGSGHLSLAKPEARTLDIRDYVSRSSIAQIYRHCEEWERGDMSPTPEWAAWAIDRVEEGGKLLLRFQSEHPEYAAAAEKVGGWLTEARTHLPATAPGAAGKQLIALYDAFLPRLAGSTMLGKRYAGKTAPVTASELAGRLGNTPFATMLEPSLHLAGAFGPLGPSPRREAKLAYLCRMLVTGGVLAVTGLRAGGRTRAEREEHLSRYLAEAIGGTLEALLAESYAEADTGLVGGENAVREGLVAALKEVIGQVHLTKDSGSAEFVTVHTRWFYTGSIATG